MRDIYEGSKNVQLLTGSLIRTVIDKVAKLRAEGKTVIALSAGEPNFNTPELIKKETIAALMDNKTHYGSNRGLPELRKEISLMLHETMDLDYDPETEILVTTGGAEAINHGILAHVGPGDEVIIFSPGFINYESVVNLSGAKPVIIPLSSKNGFQIDLKEVEDHITANTRMIVINNPCNPTGAVYSDEVLLGLAKLCCKYNLIAFSDEIYSNLVYDGKKFTSLASFPGMKERTIVMNGFSKTYAMTGWRVGYLCADARMISLMLKVHQYSTTCGTTFVQAGLAKAMNQSETKAEAKAMFEEFAKRRTIVTQELDTIPQLQYTKPQGAFYIFIDVTKTGLSGQEFCDRLLAEQLVAAVPGIGLGKGFDSFIRISYAASEADLIEAMKRIKAFVQSLA